MFKSPRVFTLKITKAGFALAIALVNASAAFGGVLVQHYVSDPIISAASAIFLATASSAVVSYLATEEQVAPSP